MYRRLGSFGHGLAALAFMLALSGCSGLAGVGSYGSNQLAATELPQIGDYTADKALSEARAHFRNSDYGYSAAYYKKFVELSPKNAEGYVGLGASYDRLGRFDLCDRVYETLYKLDGRRRRSTTTISAIRTCCAAT